ncbi:hypothetical protein OG352_06600 [Streptomyces sp. NBC_01485]|uniref:hypothetical protein n=1 Tax=Streptomyces sp. NBC_01485 TaxID=2903884 RepID=UPI002E33CA1B|nr:hypothetical protein [Streptomyces sp. NBC_01485]
MSQQYPQQPYPPQQPPPKKTSVGKTVGLGCAGIIGLLLVIGVIGAVASSSGGKDTGASSVKPAATTSKNEQPATEPSKTAKSEPKTEEPKKKTVTFKVWGTAPAGALGGLDITYGSDSDNRKGAFKNGTFTATLPLDDEALFYTVTAQLQGSGDINCSVTVDGHTEKGHASGGYNLCNAQANAGLLGGWG